VRNIAPGELITITAEGLKSEQVAANEEPAGCVFEHIYFARPDSKLDGTLVYSSRLAMGEELAREQPADADLVIGVPDSATAAAVGYARGAGLPYAEGLVKNRYVGRTFIQPDQRLRELGVGMKLNPLRALLEGKRLVVVEDSIVRGTTKRQVVAMLRKAGATEVHVRVHSPQVQYPCFYGIDMATRGELIAANRSVDEVRQEIDADSLGYLSIDGLIAATKRPEDSMCLGCLSGAYPGPVPLELDKLSLEHADSPERATAPATLGGS
jgi:amidophosphoribosyltransferase